MADRKQTFTPEFRAEAVRLAQTSGRSRREVAADLGVGLSTFGSRQSVLFERVSSGSTTKWHRDLHVWQGQLLRQRHG